MIPLPDELRESLSYFGMVHRNTERAHERWSHLDREHDALKAEYTASVARDKTYTNDAARKAEVVARLSSHQDLLSDLAGAEHEKRSAEAELARAEQSLKTLRALAAYRTAEMQLETARINASIVAEEAEPEYNVPRFPSHDDLPF